MGDRVGCMGLAGWLVGCLSLVAEFSRTGFPIRTLVERDSPCGHSIDDLYRRCAVQRLYIHTLASTHSGDCCNTVRHIRSAVHSFTAIPGSDVQGKMTAIYVQLVV